MKHYTRTVHWDVVMKTENYGMKESITMRVNGSRIFLRSGATASGYPASDS